MSNNLNKKHNQGQEQKCIHRRTVLKALAGIPVAGFLGFEIFRKHKYDLCKHSQIEKELGINNIDFLCTNNRNQKISSDILRIGFIGFGTRASQLSKGLGFMHPDEVKKQQKQKKLNEWLQQEDLNIAITGICDVFDLHAKRGLETARNTMHSLSNDAQGLPIKRYVSYHDMLADKDIDAVIIATPDHHHAPISIAAAQAGKHVYCEKSVALYEDELNELLRTVKESGIVYQLGHQNTQNVVFQQAKEIIKRNILGKITLVETTSNRNTAEGAWIRHLDANGNPKPGNAETIDWQQWLGSAPKTPFSMERYYNWTKYFDYNTGMIGQLFSHEFDAVNQLLRMDIPKSVSSSGGIYHWKDGRDMPDSLNCVFEYPNNNMTLIYSGNLMSSRNRGRVIMGNDASMQLGSNVLITIDRNSLLYKKSMKSGLIKPGVPIISFNPIADEIDAVTSASEEYYATRGLTTTTLNGRKVDVTHLHLREWLNCIRFGGETSANVDMAYIEGITCLMAHRSYVEKRIVHWNAEDRRII